MLWPEGSTSAIAELSTFLNPALPDEKVRSFCVSKLGSYLVVASKSILAMFRLKPLVPLSIYPSLFIDTEISCVIASGSGEYVAVATTDSKISVFSAQPQGYLEERLKFNYSVTPGPGEAIGAQELWLQPLDSITCNTDKDAILNTCGPFLLVSSLRGVQVVEWKAFKTKDPLNHPVPKEFEIEGLKDSKIICMSSGAYDKSKWITCLVLESGCSLLLSWDGDNLQDLQLVSETAFNVSKIRSCDYNIRLRSIALVSDEKIFVYKDVYNNVESQLTKLQLEDSRQVCTVKWTPSGVAMIVGYIDGWDLVSMLGLNVYSVQNSSYSGINAVDFMVSAESAFMLNNEGTLLVQNMLRSSDYSPAELNRPVLFGNGRLMLYHDPSARGITEGISNQSWLTIPLPTWYMAQNWPINHVSSTADGRFVAIAGTVGIMLFSVTTRQWKDIGSREFMVRGGLCWFGKRLVAACKSIYEDTIVLKMYSPAITQTNNSASSQGSLNLGPAFSGTSPQPLPQSGSCLNNAPNTHSVQSIPESPPQSHIMLPARRRSSAYSGGTFGASASTENLVKATPGYYSNLFKQFKQSSSNIDGDSIRAPLISSPSATTDFRRPSAASIPFSKFELQVLAVENLGNNCSVILVAKGPDSLLGVVFEENGKLSFLLYNLLNGDYGFNLIRSIPLQEVLDIDHPVVRSVAIVSENEILMLINTTLYLLTTFEDDSNKYERRVIVDPVEMFEFLPQDQLLCAFDGQDAVFSTWPPSNKTNVTTINLDAFPVHFSAHRGVVALVETEPIASYDNSFVVARPLITHEVYIHYLIEAYLTTDLGRALSVARRYSNAPYFSGVLENLLFHCVTDYPTESETKLALKLIRHFDEQNIEAIIANCARKIDMKYWDRLFSSAGQSSAEMFDNCLSRHDLKTATELLIIVQTTSSDFDLKGPLLRLYTASKLDQQFHICKQLCQYIMSIDATGETLKKFREFI